MKILVIGKNSVVAKEFVRLYSNTHHVISIGREDDLIDIISRHEFFDAAIFLAQSHDYKTRLFTDDLFDVNISLLHKTLRQVSGITNRFLYFSTGSVYSAANDGVYSERSEVNYTSTSPYIASKLAGELITRTYQSIIPSIMILRPFYMYGKAQKETMLFAGLYKKVKDDIEIEMKGERGLIFNPVYAGDVAELLDCLVHRDTTGVEIFNVCGSRSTDLMEVIDVLGRSFNKKPVVKRLHGTAPVAIAESSIKGWYPATDIVSGIQKSFFDV